MNNRYRIWIGYSTDEAQAFDVCAKSIKRRSSVPVEIYPIRQDWLRALGLYWRERNPLASTEFSVTRFLTPCLAGYNGPALFMDSDFLVLADIRELFDLYDPTYAVQCVKHEYSPTAETKMGGMTQTVYPKKNWSSLMLFSSDHPDVKLLTPHKVNTETPLYLHRMQWTEDGSIGSLPEEWNFLVNHTRGIEPKGLHFTEGTLIQGVRDDYSHLWEEELKA